MHIFAVIMKVEGTPPKAANLPHDFKPPVLGSAEEVRRQLSAFFPNIRWRSVAIGKTDSIFGELKEETFHITFIFNEGRAFGPIHSFAIHGHGGSEAVSVIVDMCKRAGWQARECGLLRGEFLDLEDPMPERWNPVRPWYSVEEELGAYSAFCPACGAVLPPPGRPDVRTCWNCGWHSEG
jgi:hypothetical protein